MRAYLTLTRRELASFFISPVGYIIIAATVFLMGLSFVALLRQLQDTPSPQPVTQLYYTTVYFWVVLLLVCPVITMRLFALEKFSGTFETLMTTPVSDLQVVSAKFTAAMVFYLVMWLPSVLSILILRNYIQNADVVQWSLIGCTLLGVFLLGGLFMSFGCFASSLTKNQIVAAMIGFTIGFTLFLASFLPDHLRAGVGWLDQVLGQLSLFDHMNDFSRGKLDTRHIIFYLSTTWLFLFLTLRTVESRRWK